MRGRLSVLILSLLLAAPALGQRTPAPPGRHGKRPRREPPAPGQHLPVRRPPEVIRFEPTSGNPDVAVTLFGKHFDETCVVRFNGREIPVTDRTDTWLKVRIPGRAVSDHFVVVKSGFREVTYEKMFHVVRPPVFQTFNPRSAGRGERVTIIGEHFLPDDGFFIGPVELQVVRFHPKKLEVQIPDAATTGRLRVLRGGRELAHSRDTLQIEGKPPAISGFSPRRGGPGTVVRVEGRHFEPGDQIFIGRHKLATRKRGPDFIEVVIGRQRSGQFLLRGPLGRRAESADEFIVPRPPIVRSFSPPYGTPGSTLTIEGEGFMDGDKVQVGEAILTIATLSDRKIVAKLPAGVSTGRVAVERNGRRFSARGVFDVVHPPAITSISPKAGPFGTQVEIMGRHIMPGSEVFLSGRKLPVVKQRPPEAIVVTIPPGARTAPIVVVNRGGSAQSPIPFRVAEPHRVTSYYPLHTLPGARVTIRGSGFEPGVEVFLDGMKIPVEKVTEEEIVVRIPEGAKTDEFTVVLFGRRETTRLVFVVDEPQPELQFNFAPQEGRRGTEVTLTVTPPRQAVMVFFNEQPLPKKMLREGRIVIVTIPGDARTGFFELELNGRRYRADRPFRVR